MLFIFAEADRSLADDGLDNGPGVNGLADGDDDGIVDVLTDDGLDNRGQLHRREPCRPPIAKPIADRIFSLFTKPESFCFKKSSESRPATDRLKTREIEQHFEGKKLKNYFF